ncbi:MAG: hypothetical protein HYV09_24180 [Deltaproteobacteria bacterium]|nr:hypothetical protein [Deltaproteobacteria bacterium]
MGQLTDRLQQLRGWFALSVGEAFREASAIAEPAGTSPAWAAICARAGVPLCSDDDRAQIRAGQRPTRGAPLMEFQAVIAAIVRRTRQELAGLRNVMNDEADKLHDQIRRAVDGAEDETLRAYRNLVLPKRAGGMFANATAHVATSAFQTAPAATSLTCKSCGAPHLEAGAFDCKYCGNRMV